MTKQLSEKDLRAILAAAEKASPRPWRNWFDTPYEGTPLGDILAFLAADGRKVIGLKEYEDSESWNPAVLVCSQPDAWYVVIAVNTVERLTHEVLHLRKEKQELDVRLQKTESASILEGWHSTEQPPNAEKSLRSRYRNVEVLLAQRGLSVGYYTEENATWYVFDDPADQERARKNWAYFKGKRTASFGEVIGWREIGDPR